MRRRVFGSEVAEVGSVTFDDPTLVAFLLRVGVPVDGRRYVGGHRRVDVHDGDLDSATIRRSLDFGASGFIPKRFGVETLKDPIFGIEVPTACPGVPDKVLVPQKTWANPSNYETTAKKLAKLFHDNFAQYADKASDDIRNAGPLL